MLKVHETTTATGELSPIFLSRDGNGLAIVRDDGKLDLPDGAIEAVMTRFGKALDPASPVTIVASLDLGGDRVLRHVRHLAHYDVIALDYLVYDAPGSDSLCALATIAAGALEHLARASRAASRQSPGPATIPAGLCVRCRHCKTIASARGSVFRLCLLHESDPRFAKYPRVPVVHCPGYVDKTDDEPR